MTGYGRATKRGAPGSVTVELRSTNHRYLEIEQRLSSGMTALQGRLAELVRKQVQRGRVEALVFVQSDQRSYRQVVFDEPLLQRYHEALVALRGRFGLKGAITLDHLLALPQAVTISEVRGPNEQLSALIEEAAEAAIQDLVRSRQREGAKLLEDLQRLIRLIERHRQDIVNRLPKALEQQRERVRERLQELLGAKSNGSISQLEQAVALIKEVDVHEELVRLKSHLAHMRQTLINERLIGKQLDFISQELMRETNTLGAKVNDALAARHVVQIKGTIEKIREQVQNLE